MFENGSGITSELWTYVAADAPVKFCGSRSRNDSGRGRRLSVTGYFEWVLAEQRPQSLMHVITEIDLASGALFASHPYNTEFAGRTAFLDVKRSAAQRQR